MQSALARPSLAQSAAAARSRAWCSAAAIARQRSPLVASTPRARTSQTEPDRAPAVARHASAGSPPASSESAEGDPVAPMAPPPPWALQASTTWPNHWCQRRRTTRTALKDLCRCTSKLGSFGDDRCPSARQGGGVPGRAGRAGARRADRAPPRSRRLPAARPPAPRFRLHYRFKKEVPIVFVNLL